MAKEAWSRLDLSSLTAMEYIFQPKSDSISSARAFRERMKKHKRQQELRRRRPARHDRRQKNARFPEREAIWQRPANDLCRESGRTAKEDGATAFKEESATRCRTTPRLLGRRDSRDRHH